MPIKRRLSKVRQHRITPEAVASYEAEDWRALHRALGLYPWEASPLDAHDGECHPYPEGYAKSWKQAQELRRELETALSR